ncbi:MAG TPA: hypothetical protein VGH33_11310, partial [Isosphaeraceae bacterium]
MRIRVGRLLTACAVAFVASSGTSEACHRCRQTPCVLVPPAPAMQCVTEMVPFTVNRMVTRTAFREVTETVMAREFDVTYVERQRTVCKPVWDTTTVQRTVTGCRP